MGPRKQRLAVITWFAGLALVVQALLPLFLAIEFRLATIEAPYLTATGDALCGPGHAGVPGPGNHRHGLAACPICLTLAAAQAFTPPSGIELAAPTAIADRVEHGLAAVARPVIDGFPYQARAPPRMV